MNTTTKMSYDELLRKALSKGKSGKKAKFDKKKNYASFWMDDLGRGADRFGISSDFSGKSSDLVKSIKLNSYRRAVANFVKILTNKEIPVRFAGTDSYTDGSSVTLSTDIKDDNFDVTVGLALHEASHILLTDFKLLPIISGGSHKGVEAIVEKFPSDHWSNARVIVKDLLNWVEDRRIDNYVFSTSPGYKAYYHKLYDHYFNNDKVVAKALKSKKYRNPAAIDSWMIHIVNMTNPNFNPTVMPGLQEVTDIIDLPRISRLKSTDAALDVVLQIMEVIAKYLKFEDGQTDDQQQTPQGGASGSGEGESTEDTQEGEESEDDEGEGEGAEDAEGEGGESLSDAETSEIQSHLQKQKKFGEGAINKKTASRSLTNKLDKVDKEGVTIEQVGGKYTCLNYDVTGKEFIAAANANEEMNEVRKEIQNHAYGSAERRTLEDKYKALRASSEMLDDAYFSSPSHKYVNAIQQGLLMGQLLGKKLQTRNESRERVDNRLRSGKVDNRRLSAAGYGIESIFHQVTIDKYKKANIHLSLDGSGSMSGNNWANTAKLAAAIAKAITYTQNVSMQISIRVTTHDKGTLPANYFIYDSRKNTIRELQLILGSFHPNGMTPEGLCFESMLKKNQLVKSDSDMDSYFVNISDGGPGGVGQYHGETAKIHTKNQIAKMRNELGMNILSYFMTEYTNSDFANSGSGIMFQGMYGKAATQVQPDNALQIAKTLNNMFMGK